MVITYQSRPAVALIPRQNMSGDRGIRATQVLQPFSKIKRDFPNLVYNHSDDSFTFQDRRYLACGLLIVPVADCRLSGDILPSAHELDVFFTTGHLDPKTYEHTAQRRNHQSIQMGDRVKVVLGDLAGLDGHVASIQSDIAAVELHSEERVADIPLTYLRMHLAVGDEVELLPSSWDRATGWVVGVEKNAVDVYVRSREIEVCEVHLTPCTELTSQLPSG